MKFHVNCLLVEYSYEISRFILPEIQARHHKTVDCNNPNRCFKALLGSKPFNSKDNRIFLTLTLFEMNLLCSLPVTRCMLDKFAYFFHLCVCIFNIVS